MIDATNPTTLLSANISNSMGGAGALAGISGKTNHMSDEQIDKTSKDFESMFISQMMEPMFGDSIGDAAFGSSDSGDIYKSMMLEQYAKKITAAGGIGIADYVKKELLKLQEH